MSRRADARKHARAAAAEPDWQDFREQGFGGQGSGSSGFARQGPVPLSSGRPAPAAHPAFAPLAFGPLTWLGLALALIGWLLLIAVAALADAPALRVARPALSHDDLLAVAACLIASGFAVAVIGTLRAGFGALNRFFAAVLARSATRSEAAGAAGPHPYDAGPAPDAGARRRPYRTLPDGSVEVDTILGTRRFRTMHDAQDFI